MYTSLPLYFQKLTQMSYHGNATINYQEWYEILTKDNIKITSVSLTIILTFNRRLCAYKVFEQ